MEVNDFLEGSNYRSLNNSRKRLKEKLVAYKGGKCEVCGYDKCITALEFHHLDPTEKEFGIGGKNVLSFEKCKKEVDKCILVCANCHREIHENLYTQEELLNKKVYLEDIAEELIKDRDSKLE